MSGRVLFILSFVFLVIVLFAHDNYVREHGGHPGSGLSRIIDQIKETQWPRLQALLQTKPVEYPSFINIQNEFPAFKDSSNQLKGKRQENILTRQAIFEDIRLLHRQFEKQAASFYKNKPGAYEELKQTFRSLNYEDDFLKQNIQATENRFEELFSSVEERFAKLVLEVINFNSNDLIKFADFYFPLRQNEQDLLQNLKEHYQYFGDKHNLINQRVEDILKETKGADLAALQNSFKDLKLKEADVFEKLKAQTAQFVKLCNEQNSTYENFINRMAESLDVDLNKLLEERRAKAQAAAQEKKSK